MSLEQKKTASTPKHDDFSLENNPFNEIRRTIAVLSGKGGVGKSLVTSLLAVYLQRTGKYRVGILDADITGPSIPKLFGADKAKPRPSEGGLFPVRSHSDIQLMSINVLLDDPESPVVWRGPILSNTVKQFWTDVIWGDLDFMFLDMPPGTGDVPLTVFQSIPLDGIILVTSPQDLVSMIVKKAVNMARMMNIPILGIVENMSHVVCPHCGEIIKLFGESKTASIAAKWQIPYLGSLPIDPDLAALGDQGHIERVSKNYLAEAVAAMEKVPARKNPLAEDDNEPDVAIGGGENMKKIAIATQGEIVAEHFGHCDGFTIYATDNGKIIQQEFLANPGHKPGLLPNLLNDHGISVIIAGGMGSSAIEIFNEKGIDVITGASGALDYIIGLYLENNLSSTGSVCHEHQHADNCGEH